MFTDLLIRILSIFLLIFLGGVARRRGFLETGPIRAMSGLVVNFFYPALIFTSLLDNFTVETLRANLSLPLGTVIIMSAGYLLGLLVLRAPRFAGLPDRGPARNVFLLQSTINNYSFLPLPLVFMLWGERGVAFLVFSTFGSEAMVWTLGMAALGGNRFRRDNLKRIINMPVLTIFLSVAAIFLRDAAATAGFLPAGDSIGANVGRSFMSSLEMFGAATVPLALFLTGGRMAELRSGHLFNRTQAVFTVLRLVAIPAVSIALLTLLPLEPVARMVLFTVAVMPTAVFSVVLSDLYDSDPLFAASGVLTTHLVSLLTIPLWLSFLISRFPVG